MKRITIHNLLKLLLPLLVIIGGKQCYADTVSIPLRYYHSDHLGSASWITNKTGTPVQHLQYMPYGEPLVNERTTSYEERFTFTGKERDSETGFSYFGARYYDSDLMTGWLSVDPMADKYPNISPYAYCANNPVKLVDPDGRDARIFIEKNEDGKTCIRINSTIYFESKNMSKKDLNKLVRNATLEASKMLKSKDFDDYRVEFDIEFKVYNGEKKLEGDNTFYVDPSNNESSNVKGRAESLNGILLDEFAGNEGYINSDITNSIGRSQGKGIIHETLHFFGISDRYRKSVSLPGFEKDIMGADARYSNKVHDTHYKAFINTYGNSVPKDKPYILLEKRLDRRTRGY